MSRVIHRVIHSLWLYGSIYEIAGIRLNARGDYFLEVWHWHEGGLMPNLYWKRITGGNGREFPCYNLLKNKDIII